MHPAAGIDRPPTLQVLRFSGCTDLVELARSQPGRYPFLLQSEAANDQLARFDILFACPGETLELTHDQLRGPCADPADGFLSSLDHWWAEEGGESWQPPDHLAEESLPFRGGWFIYLGYELAGEIEPGLTLSMPDDQPVAFATRIPVAVINDRQKNEMLLIAEPHAEIDQVRQDIESLTTTSASSSVSIHDLSEEEPEHFLAAVDSAKDYIRQGEIFQANLSRCWRASASSPFAITDLYKRLCETNPAPFAGMIQRQDFAVISSSPERLIRRQGDRLDTRPIAGTRPRLEAGFDGASNAAMQEELLAHPKERAEHIMLIDLERNDLGRVSLGGSVRVDEYMVLESYSHVHHIVSNVTGEARPGLKPGELIRAVFPGGTITGCPKVRCMEIIHELEARPRGAYTGSMGYLNLNGDCDLNILIRTMTVKGGDIELAAGSGIVADSIPEAELEETRAKAKGLVLALNVAGAA
ncbi:MAG: aminodeoxychorismate synthase component I [Gammaproteobacteria bacterium]